MKLCQKPRDCNRQSEVKKRLHTVLRCLHLALQTYHRHLPFSGGHVFPSPVFKIVDLFKEVSKQSKTLGFQQESENLKEDASRLFNAAKAFERKFQGMD